MDNLYRNVYGYLLSYGFSPVHKGFKYIIEAVKILRGGKVKPPMSRIYAQIAAAHNISAAAVQKNIKNAIDYASLNCSIDSFSEEFGGVIRNGGITCAAFLCYASYRIKTGNINGI